MTTQSRLFAITHQKLSKPKKLPLGTLSVDPERFQVRCGESNNIVDRTLRERAALEVIVELKEVVLAGKISLVE